jgi:hypothetical protein
MGKYFIDQFSLLHFAVGIVAFFWDINFTLFFILHSIFEIFENTKAGMYIINNYITIWPGGKPEADTIINIIGDTVFALLGWILAKYVNDKATEKQLYF